MSESEFSTRRFVPGFDSVHKCKKCPYFSKSIFQMVSHMERHTSVLQLFNCEDNDLEILELNYLPKNYVCFRCSFTSSSSLHWLKHLHACVTTLVRKNHAIVQKCGHCPFQTRSRGYFSQHMKFKHQTFKCDLCLYITNKKRNLTKHSLIHKKDNEIKWYQCNYCHFKSKRNDDLKRHVKYQHMDDNEFQWFQCEHCPYKTKLKKHLLSHGLVHKNHAEIKWFPCNHCEYKSKMNGNLKRHIQTCHTDKTHLQWFHCDKCVYKTTRKMSLEDHYNGKHAEEDAKWFHCEQCSYKTKWKRALGVHVLALHQNKND